MARTFAPNRNKLGPLVPSETMLRRLTGSILTAAANEVEQAFKSLRELAERRLAEARDEAEEVWSSATSRGETKGQQLDRRLESTARMEVQRELLRQQRLLLEQCWTNVKNRLNEIRHTDEYPQLLQRLAVQGLQQLEGNQFGFQVRADDQELLSKEWWEGLYAGLGADQGDVTIKVLPDSANISGGIIVSDSSGRNVVDNSFEYRLERDWPVLRDELVMRFFSGLGEG